MLIVRFDIVDSTQERARELLLSGIDEGEGEGLLVAAREQTAGRGRLGRSWRSPRGGLYFTFVREVQTPQHLEAAALPIGLALCEALESAAALPSGLLQLKWPNDIHARGRKLAGILCEVVRVKRRQFLLAGVGVNMIYAPEMPAADAEGAAGAGFAAPATCLAELSSDPGDPEDPSLLFTLGEAVGGAVEQHLRLGLDDAARPAVAARLRGVGCRVELSLPSGERVAGELRGLSETGGLQILTEAGEMTVAGGAELTRIHDNWLP